MKQAVTNLFFNLSWKTSELRAIPEGNKPAMDWAEERGLVKFSSKLGGLLYYRRTQLELSEVSE